MFSVFSRLGKGGGPDASKKTTPAPMSSSLQKKFSKGVHYNMKIVIKGDRNVGKSCLLQRLQGGAFIEEYQPTEQIQVAPINWTYKNTEYIVKVEVWEVVDKAQTKKKSPQGLKLENAAAPGPASDTPETPQLDATFLDVYKNANGVILMLDITKPWTFEYVQRELTGVPGDIPVIVLGNHCDMNHHRQVHPHQIEYAIETQNRSGSVRYAEASMRNGFGLRLLHKWLNVPFLQLQRSTLLAQLTTNQRHIEAAHGEMDIFQNSEDADYNTFLERLASKRRQEVVGAPKQPYERSPSIVLGGGKPIIPKNVNPLASTTMRPVSVKAYIPAMQPPTTTTSQSPSKSAQPLDSSVVNKSSVPPMSPTFAPNLDDFCAGDLDHSFLDDMSPTVKNQPAVQIVADHVPNLNKIDSDSDGEIGANPLVVKIQEDLESDEDTGQKEMPQNMISPSRTISKTAKVRQINSTENTTKSLKKNVIQEPQNMNLNIGNNSSSNLYVSSENVFAPASQLQGFNLQMSESVSDTNIFAKVVVSNEDSSKDGPNSDEEIYNRDLSQTDTYIPASWQMDANVRRSPEGGEDVSPTPDSDVKREKKSKEGKDKKKHKKSKKSSKDKDREKDKASGEKDSKTRKEGKDKKHGSGSSSNKKKEYDELEDFLSQDTSVQPAGYDNNDSD